MLQLLSLIFLSMVEGEYLLGAKLSRTLGPEAVDLAEVCGALWCCPQTSSTEPPCWFWTVAHNDITDAGLTQAQHSVVAPRPCFPTSRAVLAPGPALSWWSRTSHVLDPLAALWEYSTAPKRGHEPLLKCLVPPRRKLRYSPAHVGAVTHTIPAALSLTLCQGRFRLYIGNVGCFFPPNGLFSPA